MTHDLSLIAIIAIGLTFALVKGFMAARMKLPPLVGYLIAGIAIGPFTPGFVGDEHLAHQLAELGVILLMFGVGMHFSLADLMAVRNIAIPGAIVQIAAATVMGIGLTQLWGWSLAAGVVFGLALSVASTVVLLKALESRNQVQTDKGRIAVGWLIVEDLVIVLALVLLPALGQSSSEGVDTANVWLSLGITLGKVALFIVLMLVVGTRVFPWLLKQVEDLQSRELFTLAVVAIAIGVAYGSYKLFGVSLALGAFFAGMVVNVSDASHRAEKELKPLQDIFAALFFVSVGMLFDPKVLIEEPLKVLAVVGIIVIGKSIAALIIVLMLRHPMSTALTVSAALAQIGEFSFILVALGMSLDLLPDSSQSLIVAGAILSITLNPLVFYAVDRWNRRRIGIEDSDANTTSDSMIRETPATSVHSVG